MLDNNVTSSLAVNRMVAFGTTASKPTTHTPASSCTVAQLVELRIERLEVVGDLLSESKTRPLTMSCSIEKGRSSYSPAEDSVTA